MERLQFSASSSSDHQITTYEIFSSDEVKITSAVDNVPTNLIDLTQDDSNDGLKHFIRNNSLTSTSPNRVPNPPISFDSKFNDITSNLDFYCKTNETNASCSKRIDVSFVRSTSEELYKSNLTGNAMHLTQSSQSNFISCNLISKFNEMASNTNCSDQMISFGSSTSEEFNKSTWTQSRKRSLLDESTGGLTSKFNEMASNQSFYFNSTKSVRLDKFNCSSGVKISFGSSTSEDFNNANSIDNGDLIDKSSDSLTSKFTKMTSENEFYCSNSMENGCLDDLSSSKNGGVSFEHSASGTECAKSSGIDNQVDLTQDSDCIVLSDDEVNYSIWKANKSMANISIDHILDEVNEINEVKYKHEFSFVYLIEDTRSICGSQQINFDNNVRTGSNTSLDSLDLDLSKRSEFGILEEKSPFKTPTKSPKRTPKKTPRKTPTSSGSSKARKTLSESFLGSPKANVLPVKRFSSAKKFYEFTQSDDSLTDVDDIDKLVYGSPSKKAYKKPTGLDLLLTKPITTKDDSDNSSMEDTLQKFNFNGRVYLVRTKNIPQKPNFNVMDELSLRIWLDTYGLKPLKRKQAVKMLEYIYNQTHPYLVNEDEILSQATAAKCRDVENLEYGSDLASSHVCVSKLGLKDCWGDRLVSETGFKTEVDDEEYIFQTNTSKKILSAALPFHIAWYNLVKSSRTLHETILHYEPIDLQEIYLFFKGLGFRFDPKELRKFFDSRSIVFRYELNKDPSDGANRHKRRCRPHKHRQRIK